MQGEEFRRILQCGLGRVILYLQEHDAAPYQEYILDACLHTNAYDPQSEGNKAQYLYDIIQLTQQASFYRQAILQAMASVPPPVPDISDDLDWDVSQFFDFGLIFARQGDEEFRQAMYQLFLKRASRHCEFGADELIDLDGLDGFIFVARHLSHIDDPHSKYFQLDHFYLETIEERFGRERVLAYIEQATATEPLLKAYIKYPREKEKSGSERVVEDYEYVRQLISELKVKSTQWPEYPEYRLYRWNRLTFWGKQATEKDILLAANDLLNATSEDILPYLAIFRWRAFPLDYRALLPWATNSNIGIADLAAAALVFVESPEVRALALRLVNDPEMVDRALDLFIKNYQEGDHLLLEQLLASQNDLDDFHGVAYGILEIYEQNPTKECLQVLTQIYERDPCAHCRESAVYLLIKLQIFPDWMAQECLYDSWPDIREMAQQWLSEHPTLPQPVS